MPESAFEAKHRGHPMTRFKDLPAQSIDPVDDVVYPPRDSPVPVLTPDEVMCTQVEWIRQLKESIPMNEDDKDRYLFPVLQNMAAFVQLLPASQSHHHNGRGGLYRHSLEVALYAVRMGKMRIFDVNADPVAAYHNKGRWYLAIAIAGLLHDIGKCITDMTVSTEDAVWMPTVASLTTWLAQNNVSSYYLTWNAKRRHGQHESATLALLSTIVPVATREYLEAAHSLKLKGEFYEALSGTQRKDSVIAELVAKADAYSSQQDLNRQIREGLHPGVNAPIAGHVMAIIQTLVKNGDLAANTPEAPLIVSDKGVFLVWSRLTGRIFRALVDSNVTGIPKNETLLAEKLAESGMTERFFSGEGVGETFWSVLPACDYLDSDAQHPPQWHYLSALKLTDGEALFAERQKPAEIPVLVRQMPATEEERARWRALTGLEPPHGQDWLTGVITAEQDRDAHAFDLDEERPTIDEEGFPIGELDAWVYPSVDVEHVIRAMANEAKGETSEAPSRSPFPSPARSPLTERPSDAAHDAPQKIVVCPILKGFFPSPITASTPAPCTKGKVDAEDANESAKDKSPEAKGEKTPTATPVKKKRTHRAGRHHRKGLATSEALSSALVTDMATPEANAPCEAQKEEEVKEAQEVNEGQGTSSPKTIFSGRDSGEARNLTAKEKAPYARALLLQLREELLRGGGEALSPAPLWEDDVVVVSAVPLLRRLAECDIDEAVMQWQLGYVSDAPALSYDPKKAVFRLQKTKTDEKTQALKE